jgi:DNA polymerase iota
MDVTDLIDYNFALLNRYDLTACFFHLDRNDPTVGFEFDASRPFGNTYPAATECPISPPHLGGASPEHHQSAFLYLRLILGSFLARHLRHQLEEQKGYTATAGISVNKLLSKLVGNLNKPHDQTTLLSSSSCHDEEQETTVMRFMDSHEIGKIPGIGFKMAQKIREYMLGRPATHNGEIMYGSVRDRVPVRDVRLNPEMSPALLEKLIGGPGVHRNMGDKIWELLHGVDDSEVSKAKDVPRQISIVCSRPDLLRSC